MESPLFITRKLISSTIITDFVEEKIIGTDLFIVDVIVRNGNSIIVLLDSDNKVTIADCSSISKHIESKLDRDKEDFELEVSSAGMDRPLKHIRQYKKHLGREVIIITKDGLKRNAKLIEVLTSGIKIEEQIVHRVPGKKSKQITVEQNYFDFDQIKETKIAISFK